MQLTYDKAPVTLGSLHSSAWVFVLLGAFYATIGSCFPVLDALALPQSSGMHPDSTSRLTMPYHSAGFTQLHYGHFHSVVCGNTVNYSGTFPRVSKLFEV
jgi:hypothetical protein